jgi:hypothetical protein
VVRFLKNLLLKCCMRFSPARMRVSRLFHLTPLDLIVLTNCMELSPSRGAAGYEAKKFVTCYQTGGSLPFSQEPSTVRYLSQMNYFV